MHICAKLLDDTRTLNEYLESVPSNDLFDDTSSRDMVMQDIDGQRRWVGTVGGRLCGSEALIFSTYCHSPKRSGFVHHRTAEIPFKLIFVNCNINCIKVYMST